MTTTQAIHDTNSDDAFEAARPELLGLAYRMLGTVADAEDVVQDAWLRWHAADHSVIERPAAWLTRVVTRLCLDRLRSARHQRESYIGPWLAEPIAVDRTPEEHTELAESLTLGFLALADGLRPVERAVFLLADVFKVPYADIAEMIGRSEAACRQVASRARRRLSEAAPPARRRPGARAVIDGFLEALIAGDVEGVVRRVAPSVRLVTDGGAHQRAARRPITGAPRVTRLLVNVARKWRPRLETRPATLNGQDAILRVDPEDGSVVSAWVFTVAGDEITEILVVTNRDKLAHVEQPVPLR